MAVAEAKPAERAIRVGVVGRGGLHAGAHLALEQIRHRGQGWGCERSCDHRSNRGVVHRHNPARLDQRPRHGRLHHPHEKVGLDAIGRPRPRQH